MPAKTHGGKRKQDTKNKTPQNKNPARGEERNKQNSWTEVTPDSKTSCSLHPRGAGGVGGGNTGQCLAALLKGSCRPALRPQLTGLHCLFFFLGGFFFRVFFFFLIPKPSIFKALKKKVWFSFSFLRKKKKKNLKLMRQAPGLALPPGGLPSPGPHCQSPAQRHWGDRGSGFPLDPSAQVWVVLPVALPKQEKGDCPPFRTYPDRSGTLSGMCKLSGGRGWEVERNKYQELRGRPRGLWHQPSLSGRDGLQEGGPDCPDTAL